MAIECMDCGNVEPDEVGRMCPECGGTMRDKLVYEAACDTCGELYVHESRNAAEGKASLHTERTDHDCTVTLKSV